MNARITVIPLGADDLDDLPPRSTPSWSKPHRPVPGGHAWEVVFNAGLDALGQDPNLPRGGPLHNLALSNHEQGSR